MSVLDTLTRGMKYAVTEAASYSREWMDLAKLNAAINARKQELEASFAELGKTVFARECDDPESPSADLCKKILELQEVLNDLSDRVVTLKEEGKAEREQVSADFHAANRAADGLAVDDASDDDSAPQA